MQLAVRVLLVAVRADTEARSLAVAVARFAMASTCGDFVDTRFVRSNEVACAA